MDSKQLQSSNTVEIPRILLVVALAVAFAAPRLPVMFRKGLVMAGTLVWIGGLCYLVLIPGRKPINQSRMRRMWKRILFPLLAGVLSFGAAVLVTATPEVFSS